MSKLKEVFLEKNLIINSDKIDLCRQSIEIQTMQAFMKNQAENADPLEFLKLSQGNDLLKLFILS